MRENTVTNAATTLTDLRRYMFSLAYRMLGSVNEAEDIVQDAFIRLQNATEQGVAVESTKAYLSTITTRLAIDHLRSAQVRRETYFGSWLPEPVVDERDPENHLVAVFEIDICDGLVCSIRSVVNPDKLQHLGPVSAFLRRLK